MNPLVCSSTPTFSRPKVLGIGDAPYSHEHTVAKDWFPAFDFDHTLAVADPRGGDPAPEVELQTLPLEELPGLGGDFGVQPEQDAIQELKDGDLGPKPPPDGAQLEADVACANHDQVFGRLGIGKCLGAGPNSLAVQGHAGQSGGFAAGSNQDGFALEFEGARRIDHRDAPGAFDPAAPLIAGNPVLFEEGIHAAGQGCDNLILAAEHRGQVQREFARGDVIVVRYADDTVLGFQAQTEADRFLDDLRERLRKFGLELHPEKTRRIEFGRYAESNGGNGEEKASPRRSTFWASRTSAGRAGRGTLP